jgi:hypothetical protein
VSVLRIDAVTLLRRDDVVVDPDSGFRVYDALFARTGLQLYDDGRGGVSREYRPPSEVFDAASLASYEGRPLTDGHPANNLTTQTASMFARGSVSGPGRKHTDGIHVVGRLSVWDESLIEKFDAGQVDLSAGYSLEPDHTPGIGPDGKRHDLVHRKIRINHMSGVIEGRAGTARILTNPLEVADGWGFADPGLLANIASQRKRPVYVDMGRWARHDSADLRRQHTSTKDTTKMKFKIDGKDVELDVPDKATPQQIADAVTKHGVAKAKAALDAAVKLAVEEALAKAKPKTDGKKDEPKTDAAREAAHAAEIKALKQAQADNIDRADALSVARGVLGLGYTAADTTTMKLDTIEKVLGKDERDAVAKDPGAIGYMFARAAKKFEADRHVDHGGALLQEIQRVRAAKVDGRDKPKDTTAADRKAAADRASMTRAQRKAHDAKKAS